MELRTLAKIENKRNREMEHERQPGKTGDITRRRIDDIETIAKLLETFSPKVVLVPIDLLLLRQLELGRQNTASCNDDRLFQAIKAGSVAYLGQDTSANEAAVTVGGIEGEECPINGGLQVRTKAARQALRYFQDLTLMEKSAEVLNMPLTRRETQTLRYMAGGYSNKQIARTLYVSEQTVKNHVSSVQHKLGANNRTHAVVLALRMGCIDIEESVPEA